MELWTQGSVTRFFSETPNVSVHMPHVATPSPFNPKSMYLKSNLLFPTHAGRFILMIHSTISSFSSAGGAAMHGKQYSSSSSALASLLLPDCFFFLPDFFFSNLLRTPFYNMTRCRESLLIPGTGLCAANPCFKPFTISLSVNGSDADMSSHIILESVGTKLEPFNNMALDSFPSLSIILH